MDLSPELFETVTFRERLRGYDTAEVDEFLERVGVAVGELVAVVATERQRTFEAEKRASENAELDSAMRSILVAAKRAADDLVDEARDEAARLISEAEATVRERIEEGTRTLADRVASLKAERASTEAEIERLREELRTERARIRDELASRLAELETVVDLPAAESSEETLVDVQSPPQ